MYLENTRKTGLLKIGRRCAIFLKKFDPSNRHVIQQALQLRKPSSQISNFNLRTGILITGCMACGGGRTVGTLNVNLGEAFIIERDGGSHLKRALEPLFHSSQESIRKLANSQLTI